MKQLLIPIPLLHPKHGLIGVGIETFCLLIHLPWNCQLRLGRWMERIAFVLLRQSQDVVKSNLQLCFLQLSTNELERIIKQHYKALGISIFEICMVWCAPIRIRPTSRIQRFEHQELARERGSRAILFPSYFTTLEINGRYFREGSEMVDSYRDLRNTVTASIMHSRRIDKMQIAALTGATIVAHFANQLDDSIAVLATSPGFAKCAAEFERWADI